MDQVDVLVVAALPEEFDAARSAASAASPDGPGVASWRRRHAGGNAPFLVGDYRTTDGSVLSIALARPIRMGGRGTGPITAVLTNELRPACLAMCGVCAGNPASTTPGDVVVAEVAFQWDEGKLSTSGFEGDLRQVALDPEWVRFAQDFDPIGLPHHGPASVDESRLWLLERLDLGQEPRAHPARDRYFPRDTWARRLKQLEVDGLTVRLPSGRVQLTEAGAALVKRWRYDEVAGPRKLPFAVHVGPMASGNAVVSDARIWQRLQQMGNRRIAAVEMEAATIAAIATEQRVRLWLVAKGVMDSADSHKDDRYKRFAASASAEVLFALLGRHMSAVLSSAATTATAARWQSSPDDLTFDQRHELAMLLHQAPLMGDSESRRGVIRQLPDKIRLNVREYATPNLELLGVVDTLLAYPDGFQHMFAVLERLGGDSSAVERLRAAASAMGIPVREDSA